MSQPLKSDTSTVPAIILTPYIFFFFCFFTVPNINIYTNLGLSLPTTKVFNGAHSSPYLSHGAARWLHILITLPLPKHIPLKHLKVPKVSSKEVKYLGRP